MRKSIQEKQQVKIMRARLAKMLSVPLFGSNFSGKYPTQSGYLIAPVNTEVTNESGAQGNNEALSVMKKESAAFSKLVKTVKPSQPKKEKSE